MTQPRTLETNGRAALLIESGREFKSAVCGGLMVTVCLVYASLLVTPALAHGLTLGAIGRPNVQGDFVRGDSHAWVPPGA